MSVCPLKLAIVTSHPVQYYAPWFRLISSDSEINLRVFYLWRTDRSGTPDPEFLQTIRWDISLLDGYSYEWIKNASARPGTDHFTGLHNPDAVNSIASWQPHAILCLGYLYATFLKLMIHPALFKTPFLIRGDSHRLHPRSRSRQMLKDLLIRILFKRFSAALYCGSANLAYFQSLGFPPEKLYFCPHGIDTTRFTPEAPPSRTNMRAEWNIPSDHRIILFAGKFTDKKRPLDLLQAFQALQPEKTSLVFVGDGPLREHLLRALGKNMILHPFTNQSLMPEVYRTADLLVMPSFGSSETWGLAAQEALACGTPVLLSNHTGCHPDLVSPGQNGLVFQAGNINDLIRCLKMALSPGTLESWSSQTSLPLNTYHYEMARRGLRASLGLQKDRKGIL